LTVSEAGTGQAASSPVSVLWSVTTQPPATPVM
jgi:hypothetical protein